MDKQQLEMSFQAGAAFRPCPRRSRRVTRARWWFQQMRQAVDRAWDWQPASADQAGETQPPPSSAHPRN